MKMNKAVFAVLAVFLVAAILVGAGSAAPTIFPYTQLNSSLADHKLQLTSDLTKYVTVDSDAVIRSTDFIVGAYKDVTSPTGATEDFYLTYPDATLAISLTGVAGSTAIDKVVSKDSGLDFTAKSTGKILQTDLDHAAEVVAGFADDANTSVYDVIGALNAFNTKVVYGSTNLSTNASVIANADFVYTRDILSNASKATNLSNYFVPIGTNASKIGVAVDKALTTPTWENIKAAATAANNVIVDLKKAEVNVTYAYDALDNFTATTVRLEKQYGVDLNSAESKSNNLTTLFGDAKKAFYEAYDSGMDVDSYAKSAAVYATEYWDLMPSALLFTTPAGGQTTFLGDKNSATEMVGNKFTVNTLADNHVKAGTWSVQAKFNNDHKLFKSDVPLVILDGYTKASFSVATATDSVTADKDTLVRGNSIIITVQGTPGKFAVLDISKNGLILVRGQGAVKYTEVYADAEGNTYQSHKYDKAPEGIQQIVVDLGTTGTAKIQLDTDSNTPDETFKVTAKFYTEEFGLFVYDDSKRDVSFKVEKGSVSIKADEDSYYIGNEISVSGTNTETDSIYLYIKGANKDLQQIPVGDDSYVTDSRSGEKPIVVNSDYTWSKKFTIANRFDAGTYSIYAAVGAFELFSAGETAHDDDNGQYVKTESESFKSKVSYETCAITLKQPFLTATAESNTIAKGDKIKVTGTVEGTPDSLIYYVFGTNHFDYGTITPEDDGSYSKKIDTANIATGQYFVVIQHPMYDKLFNVLPGDMASDLGYGAKDIKTTIYSFKTNEYGKIELGDLPVSSISDLSTRQNANGAEAVCKLIDEEYVDDIYVKLDFVVANAYMTINAIADQTQGSSFKVSGTTNVKVDEDVNIDVVSTKFQAEPKASVSASSYLVQSTKVVAGSNGVNTFEATFDGTPLAVDAYTAIATIPRATDDLKMSTTFNIIKGAATPTGTGTAAPTVTTPVEPTQTSTPAKTPGFGALIALAGLGAVAVLVLRRQ